MAATAFGPIDEHNEEATVRVSNLDPECDEGLLWELMIQAGPVKTLNIPKDKTSGESQGVAYVEYKIEDDASYATRILNMIKLLGKPIRLQKVTADAAVQHVDIGANLFIGNLDPDVDEKLLMDTFSTFGTLSTQPKIVTDDAGMSKGYGFVSFENFDAADKAIEAMNSRYLMNKKLNLSYSLKKDGKERHGTEAERFLAAGRQAGDAVAADYYRAPLAANRYFSDGPGRPITGPADEAT
eukprot:gene14546-22257_t